MGAEMVREPPVFFGDVKVDVVRDGGGFSSEGEEAQLSQGDVHGLREREGGFKAREVAARGEAIGVGRQRVEAAGDALSEVEDLAGLSELPGGGAGAAFFFASDLGLGLSLAGLGHAFFVHGASLRCDIHHARQL